ncbi:UNVERIFIED_CONTAM: hypothetical protein FKN15_043075 [Acipenser sinensis]
MTVTGKEGTPGVIHLADRWQRCVGLSGLRPDQQSLGIQEVLGLARRGTARLLRPAIAISCVVLADWRRRGHGLIAEVGLGTIPAAQFQPSGSQSCPNGDVLRICLLICVLQQNLSDPQRRLLKISDNLLFVQEHRAATLNHLGRGPR